MNIKVINYQDEAMAVPTCKRSDAHDFRYHGAAGTFEARYVCRNCHMMLQAKYVG